MGGGRAFSNTKLEHLIFVYVSAVANASTPFSRWIPVSHVVAKSSQNFVEKVNLILHSHFSYLDTIRNTSQIICVYIWFQITIRFTPKMWLNICVFKSIYSSFKLLSRDNQLFSDRFGITSCTFSNHSKKVNNSPI